MHPMTAIKVLGLLTAVAAITTGCGTMGHATRVELSQVPAPVSATLMQATAGGKVEHVDRKEDDGRVWYVAEYEQDGKEQHVKVAEDGTLLKHHEHGEGHEQDVDLAKAPPAVQAAIQAGLAGAELKELERHTSDGQVTYDAEYLKDGKKMHLQVDESGQVLAPRDHEK